MLPVLSSSPPPTLADATLLVRELFTISDLFQQLNETHLAALEHGSITDLTVGREVLVTTIPAAFAPWTRDLGRDVDPARLAEALGHVNAVIFQVVRAVLERHTITLDPTPMKSPSAKHYHAGARDGQERHEHPDSSR